MDARLSTGHQRGSELRRSIAAAAEQIDGIITAAQDLAEEIRREAEAEADRYLEQRKREADRIVEERISGVRRSFAALRAELDELEERAVSAADPAPDETPEARPAARSRPERPVPRSTAYPGTAATDAPETRRGDAHTDRAAALIRASQLAIRSRSREQIIAALRAEFDLERPEQIVDEVLPPSQVEFGSRGGIT